MAPTLPPEALSGVPMHWPPAPFDLDLAVTCAKLVDIGYAMESQWRAQGKPGEKDFAWKPPTNGFDYSTPIWGESKMFAFFERWEPFAFVARRGAQTFVIVRGTATKDDDIEDLKIHQVPCDIPGLLGPGGSSFGRVHEGFLQIYLTMRDALLEALGTPPSNPGQLIVSGHSLGSSLATLAFPDILVNSGYQVPEWQAIQINLASPRTGDPTFAANYNAMAANQAWKNAVTYRVVNTSDVVPEVPPAELADTVYQHVGIPVCFTAQYGSLLANHSCEKTYLYALEHPAAPIDPQRLPHSHR